MVDRTLPLESPLGPSAPVEERVQQEWRSFFSGPIWPDFQEWLEEARQAAHEGLVNSKTWEDFREQRGRFFLAEQVFNYFEDHFEEATGKPMPV
jgi:hypothetical protein